MNGINMRMPTHESAGHSADANNAPLSLAMYRQVKRTAHHASSMLSAAVTAAMGIGMSIAACIALLGCHVNDEPIVVEHRLIELAGDPDSPIKFRERTGEFHLVYDTTYESKPMEMSVILMHSPFTGAPLPSGQSDLFMTPDLDEVRTIREKLKDARTLAEVQAILGDPTSTWTREGVYLAGNQRAQHVYADVATTVKIVIREYADGNVNVTYVGKRKPRRAQRMMYAAGANAIGLGAACISS